MTKHAIQSGLKLVCYNTITQNTGDAIIVLIKYNNSKNTHTQVYYSFALDDLLSASILYDEYQKLSNLMLHASGYIRLPIALIFGYRLCKFGLSV